MSAKNTHIFFGSALLIIATSFMGYIIPRDNFVYELIFFSLGLIGLHFSLKSHNQQFNFYLGLFLRLVLLFSTPLLSDDYFRFLWDGFLTSEGINPYELKPSELIQVYQDNGYASSLFSGMNSPDYYSIYPPVNQWLFYIASLPQNIFSGILILRVFIIAFEIGLYFTIKEILKRYKFAVNRVNLYWLNPIVVLEITGNLHAEGILLFFLLTGLFALSKLQDLKGGLLIGLSFCSKLFSLMILPLLLLKGGIHRWQKLLIGFSSLVVLSFIPFLDFSNISHLTESLTLYFKTFEFNGSIFNVVKWFGYRIKGYDIIHTAGPLLSIISSLIILIISWKYRFRNRKVIFTGITLIISCYFFFSPILHPWYLIIPMTIGIFTQLKFPFIWSITAFLSYSFYDNNMSESVLTTLLITEYLIVGIAIMFDYKKLKAI